MKRKISQENSSKIKKKVPSWVAQDKLKQVLFWRRKTYKKDYIHKNQGRINKVGKSKRHKNGDPQNKTHNPSKSKHKEESKPKSKKKRIGRKLKRYKMGSSNKRKVHLESINFISFILQLLYTLIVIVAYT